MFRYVEFIIKYLLIDGPCSCTCVEFFTICFSIAKKSPYTLLLCGPEALNSVFSGTSPNGYTIL